MVLKGCEGKHEEGLPYVSIYVDKSKKDNEMKYQYKRKSIELLLQDTILEKGIENGEKQKALEIAEKLLKKGFSVEEVADDTGLDVEEVKAIQD